MNEFKILSINTSKKKGEKKSPIFNATVKENYGIVSDGHAGDQVRQISMLAIEDINKMREKLPSLKPGDFAENLTTEGIDLPARPLGTLLRINDVILKISKIGKECHHGCAIKQETGDCVMPKRGIFAIVMKGGTISPGDTGYF